MILLHHACMRNDFSADLIRVLVEAYPQGWTVQDNSRKTPKQYLIKSASRKDENGMLLLHRQAAHCKGLSVESLNILFEAYSEAIRIQDNFGLLPLHHACLNEVSSLDALMSLVTLYPESILVRCTSDQRHSDAFKKLRIKIFSSFNNYVATKKSKGLYFFSFPLQYQFLK